MINILELQIFITKCNKRDCVNEWQTRETRILKYQILENPKRDSGELWPQHQENTCNIKEIRNYYIKR